MEKYFKLTNKSCCHNKFQFVEGLNIDIVPFTNYGDCLPGGIYFTAARYIQMWINYNDDEMYYIWEVEIPEDARVYRQAYKLKADKIILSNKKTLYDFFSDNLQIAFINLQENSYILTFIKPQTYSLCLQAVKINGNALRYVKEQAFELQTPNGCNTIWYEEICVEAIKQTAYAIQYVKTDIYGYHSICLIAVKINGLVLLFIKNPTPEICLAAVQQDGRSLEYVKEQTPEMCMTAVRRNGLALQYVKEKTAELCLAAVQNNGYAMRYVLYQTPEVCLAAVRNNGYAIQYIEEKTDELCLEAVKQNGFALAHITNQTSEICLAAVRQNGLAFQFVKNMTNEILMVARNDKRYYE